MEKIVISTKRARPLVACRSALPLSTEGTKEPTGRKKRMERSQEISRLRSK